MKIPHVLTLLAAVSLSVVPAVFATLPVVSNVSATQRAGTKIVDISYDVADADGDTLKIRVEVSDDAGVHYSIPAFSFTGAIGDNIVAGTGKAIVWDAGTDWDGEYSDKMRVKVIAVDGKGLPGLEWGTEVPAGGFLMGQDGGAEGTGPSRHVNIPWSYWLSKYEVTNDQYCEFLNTALVAGEVTRNGTIDVKAVANKFTGVPSAGLLLKIGDAYDIAWNVNNFEVVGGRGDRPVSVTWYGAIAFAQHYGYDLPTTAEWEKAARGPDNDDQDQHLLYPWGNTLANGHANYSDSGDPYGNIPSEKTPVGYYNGNQTPFGPNTANAHGLYDLIGNVSEWTRSIDSTIESYSQIELLSASHNALTDTSGYRLIRGGSFADYISSSPVELKIYNRIKTDVDNYTYNTYFGYSAAYVGFRVIRRAP
jgi:formylglycine-generating enzyme required for sulfatase activity